jgi:hypothetical protein
VTKTRRPLRMPDGGRASVIVTFADGHQTTLHLSQLA